MAPARCPFCPDDLVAFCAANVRLRTLIEAKDTEMAALQMSYSGATGCARAQVEGRGSRRSLVSPGGVADMLACLDVALVPRA